MSTLSIYTSSPALEATTHTLITKRSNKNFIKYLSKLGKARCNDLEDYETEMNVVNACDYVMGCYKDIEDIEVYFEEDKIEQLHFIFEKNSDTLLNLAYSLLIIIRAIVREDYFAELISGGFNYPLSLNDHNEVQLYSGGYGSVC